MIRARASLAISGFVAAAGAVWFASSWVDPSSGDSTCGNIWQVGTWRHLHACTGPMTARLVVALALAAMALGALWLSATKPPRRGPVIGLAILLIVGTVLVVNENVRSDGLWSAASVAPSVRSAAHPGRD